MSRYTLLLATLSSVLALSATGAQPSLNFKVTKFAVGDDGGSDLLTAEPGTGRVFVTRGTHVMVLDGATGKLLNDICGTPGVHGVALAPLPGTRAPRGPVIGAWLFAIHH